MLRLINRSCAFGCFGSGNLYGGFLGSLSNNSCGCYRFNDNNITVRLGGNNESFVACRC